MALEEIVKHIRKERPEFDVVFLEESLEEQKKEVQRLSNEAKVQIFPAAEDIEGDTSVSQDPQSLRFSFLGRHLRATCNELGNF